MENSIEKKMEEAEESEIYTSKDLADLLQMAHKMRIDEMYLDTTFCSTNYKTFPTRDEAIQRIQRSLSEFVIEGITTTIDLHKKILNHKKFINSDFDVNWLSKENFY